MRRLIAARSSFSKYTARARRMNSAVECLRAFLVADVILDNPQPLVDLEQRGHVGRDVGVGVGRGTPGFLEQRKFDAHVGKFAGIAHAIADLIRRMVILSSNSPGETGTLMSLMAAS